MNLYERLTVDCCSALVRYSIPDIPIWLYARFNVVKVFMTQSMKENNHENQSDLIFPQCISQVLCSLIFYHITMKIKCDQCLWTKDKTDHSSYQVMSDVTVLFFNPSARNFVPKPLIWFSPRLSVFNVY